MNYHRKIKKLYKFIRPRFSKLYFKIPEYYVNAIQKGDLVRYKHKLSIKKYHGIVTSDPQRVVLSYGMIKRTDAVDYMVKVKWSWKNKTAHSYEMCDNLEVISSGKP